MKKARGTNYMYYNYKIYNDNADDIEYYKTMAEITNIYGISRANIYLMIKDPLNENRIKYKDLLIEKCRHHYLEIDAGISADLLVRHSVIN